MTGAGLRVNPIKSKIKFDDKMGLQAVSTWTIAAHDIQIQGQSYWPQVFLDHRVSILPYNQPVVTADIYSHYPMTEEKYILWLLILK